jgi:hypothetical protein
MRASVKMVRRSTKTVVSNKPRYSVSRKGMGGRPTKYKPEMCELVIDLMSKGYTYHMILLQLYEKYGISDHAIMTRWREKYPEFKKAFDDGERISRGWWEKKGYLNITMGKDLKFNTGPWAMIMVNKFGYRNTHAQINETITSKVEHSGKVDTVQIDFSKVSDEIVDKLMDRISQARTAEGKPIAAESIRNSLH